MRFFVLSIFLMTSFSTFAQTGGVKGNITISDGTPLGYTTIYIKQSGTGTASNTDGFYEIELAPGNYTITYQFLGYMTETREVTVGDTKVEMNIAMKEQAVQLPNAVVRGDKEDPAYSIMRKVIAKAPYHLNQMDDYTAMVYTKGTGQLSDYPWLAKKALEKEGIEKDRVFVSESVVKFHFHRPKTYEQNVISVRSDGRDNNSAPNAYIFGSFYEEEIADIISPLSSHAFAYYRFEYEGTFTDRDVEVTKIRVIPRVKGEDVVDGTINIVEDLWCLHSVDLHAIKLGVDISIRQIYNPIVENVWLPVSHKFALHGRTLGFEFNYNYLATVSNYQITLNPDLIIPEMKVIDEKTETPENPATSAKKKRSTSQLQKRLSENEEISSKELKSIIKEYEKDEQKQQELPEVISSSSFKIDSGAYKKDSSYWEKIRPIPLTPQEVTGYEKTDSMAVVRRQREEGDSVQSKSKGFQPWDLLLGDNYRLARGVNFRIEMPFLNFNTVEGVNAVYRLRFGMVFRDTARTRLNVGANFRYGFATEKFSPELRIFLRRKSHTFTLEGGQTVRQLNNQNPILPIVNTLSTLLLEQNLMKIYQSQYVQGSISTTLNPYMRINGSVGWENRQELMNNSNYRLVDRKNIEEYTPNRPENYSLNHTGFPEHQAFIGTLTLTARPWLKFRMRNGNKIPIGNSSPTLRLTYKTGIPDIFGSDISFDRMEGSFEKYLRFGHRGTLGLFFEGGGFLSKDSISFIDYKHFQGNLTPVITTEPIGSYRLLDYYFYSTTKPYLTSSAHYQFRRFILSSFTYLRLLGIKENIFISNLYTPAVNYTELGYSVDGILRLFRLEFASSFRNGLDTGYGFRLGISTTFVSRYNN